MILIIAEKPSLARNIVAGIGKMNKHDGFFDGSGYIVTWAFGHLFSLCDIEEYEDNTQAGKENGPKTKRFWTMDNLPCFPQKFKFRLKSGPDGSVDSGVRKQFNTIKALCLRSDVDTIVNAGDADREGEIIVRLCVENALAGTGAKKDFRRLWLPDQTPETVSQALKTMETEDHYDNLANEGYARTYIDWLYGMNLTRYATLTTGSLLRVGRVIVPIVKAIYDRDIAIENFQPEIYYSPCSAEETNGEKVELQSKKRFSKDEKADAEALCKKYNDTGAFVKSCKSKKDILKPGKLYSLSTLQSVLGKKYKMSMDKSLAIVQKLYEEGYMTYPRTNSEYLATAEKDKIKTILSNVKKLGYPVIFKDSKTIFDDSKIESHSALTPTYKIPDKNKLSEDEYKVYSTVMRRFAAVFCEQDCIINKSEIVVSVGDLEDFSLKGTVIVEKGWTKFDDYGKNDKVLPNLKKGDIVNINFAPAEKQTTPPKHYTIDTLNAYLKNPFKEDKADAAKNKDKAKDADSSDEPQDDSEDYKAIFEGLELGTEATRTGIIQNAIDSHYIELKKDVYTILPGGRVLIESLADMQISMDKYKTSQMGVALKKVFHGAITVDDSVALAENEISEIFDKSKDLKNGTDIGVMGQEIGKCPFCGGVIRRTKFGYGCSNYKEGCKFTVNSKICGRLISAANVKLAIETGHTDEIDGFLSKRTGKTFKAKLKLDMEQKRLVFDFDNKK